MEDAEMDSMDIRGFRTDLSRFLRRFESCAQDKNTRNYFRIYIQGLISNLPRKNAEAIALQAGEPVRSVQWFLARQTWDHERMRNKLQKIIAKEHAGKHSVGIIDETSFVKKGTKTPGVQRQHCGTVGKQENCVVTVHTAYDVGDFHATIDQDLFLPESWDADRERCREAGIPDDIVYRPKWQIALEQYDQAWVKYVVKETGKGPVLWETKECTIFIRCEKNGVAMEKLFRLIVARNVLNEKEEEIKYFVTNAPADVPVDELFLVAFSRWRVERSFQLCLLKYAKQKLDMDHFETRTYTSLIRHLLLCSLAYYFLQLQWFERSKKRSVDVLSGFSRGGDGTDASAERVAHVVRERVLSVPKHRR